jgi:hypothetical protein
MLKTAPDENIDYINQPNAKMLSADGRMACFQITKN